MIAPWLALIAVLAAPVVLLLATAGCVGKDPDVAYREGEQAGRDKGTKEGEDKGREEGQKAGHEDGYEQGVKEGKEQGAAAAKNEITEAERYDLTIQKEPQLVAYWRLNEPQGQTIANDSAPPKQHNGAYKHTAGVSLGQKGVLALFEDQNDKCATFLGTQGYVDIPANAVLAPPEFTVEFWIKPTGSSTTPQVVLGCYEETAGTLTSGFLIDLIRTLGPTGKTTLTIRATLGGAGQSLEADLGPGTQREGWRHVVLSYQRSTPSSARLYVDATTGAPATEVDSLAYTVPATAQPLRLGAGKDNGAAATHFLEGSLDEVALYNVALTNGTVMNHYQKSF